MAALPELCMWKERFGLIVFSETEHANQNDQNTNYRETFVARANSLKWHHHDFGSKILAWNPQIYNTYSDVFYHENDNIPKSVALPIMKEAALASAAGISRPDNAAYTSNASGSGPTSGS